VAKRKGERGMRAKEDQKFHAGQPHGDSGGSGDTADG
jgi:hypothetical protein